MFAYRVETDAGFTLPARLHASPCLPMFTQPLSDESDPHCPRPALSAALRASSFEGSLSRAPVAPYPNTLLSMSCYPSRWLECRRWYTLKVKTPIYDTDLTKLHYSLFNLFPDFIF